MPKDPSVEMKIGLLYRYVDATQSADHFSVYPGGAPEVIVYRTIDGPGGNERGKVPVVQGDLDDVLVYMRKG
jgi:hypothetical protein